MVEERSVPASQPRARSKPAGNSAAAAVPKDSLVVYVHCVGRHPPSDGAPEAALGDRVVRKILPLPVWMRKPINRALVGRHKGDVPCVDLGRDRCHQGHAAPNLMQMLSAV